MAKTTISPPMDSAQLAAVRGTVSSARVITVPWGPDGSLDLTFPPTGVIASADVSVISADLSGSLVDYAVALEQALDSPVAFARLDRLVTPGTTVAIVVDDPSRWTPVRDVLPIVLRRLHSAGVRPEDVTISIGAGRHRVLSPEGMRKHLGTSITVSYRCFSPPVDDLSAYIDLGQTPQGIRLRVFRPVAEANLRILIGSVLPHLQAGFGGGCKLIFPGTSHRTTLAALHQQGLQAGADAARLLGGNAADNPMRQAVNGAAALLGPCWSISHLIGGQGQVFRVLAGDPEQVQDLLAAEAKRRLQVPSAPMSDLVVVGNYPWPGDPMQSFKVLLHHRAANRPGGVLVGLFWTDLEEIARSFPIGLLRQIVATGAWGGVAIRGLLPLAQRFASLSHSPATFMLRWACELVTDRTALVYAPPLRDRLGPWLGPVRLFDDQAALWHAAATVLERQGQRAGSLRVRIFPHGGLTYVPRYEGATSLHLPRISL
jgi:nickel-dependent lactate racemase